MAKPTRSQEHQNKVFEILIQGGQWAFFNELEKDSTQSAKAREVLATGRSRLSQAMSSLQINRAADSAQEDGERIKSAMEFLKNAADFERSKEIAFFKTYKKDLPSKLQELFSSPDNFDYISFIAGINSALKTSETFRKLLNGEIERIKSRNTATRTTYKDSKGENQTRIEGHSRENYYLQTNSERIFRGFINNQSIMGRITNLIIEKGGAGLIKVTDKFNLDERKFTALLLIVQQKILELLAIELANNKIFELNASNLETYYNNIAQIIDDQLNDILDLLSQNDNLIIALNSVADQYGITEETMKKVAVSTKEVKATGDKITKMFEREKAKIPQSVGKISHKKLDVGQIVRASKAASAIGYYTGEDLSLTNWLMNNFIAMLGGRGNPTDDIQAGKLIINIDIDEEKIDKTLGQQLANVQEEAYRQQIKAISDVESFKQNTEALRNAREKQKEILANEASRLNLQEQNLANIMQHFNIHTTIKGYFSAGDTKGYFAKDGGFSGASFGANLVSEINIVNEVITASGATPLTDQQIEFLTFAAMNAGRNLIGRGNKTTLEDYFSTFAGLLMFNDAALMAEDIGHMNEHLATSTVTDLHMYELNGVIIPTSFILSSTYQALSGAASQIIGTTEKAAIRARLQTYDSAYQYGSDPVELSNKVLGATKFHIYFMAGFLDVLQNIQNAMQ